MKHRTASLACLCLITCIEAQEKAHATPVPDPTQAAREAVRAYLTPELREALQFPLFENVDLLLARQPERRRSAADHLLALMIELTTHAEAQVAQGADDGYQWRAKAHELHLALARALGELPLGEGSVEAEPVALWLWLNGKDGEERAMAAYALTSVLTPNVDALLLSFVNDGCPVTSALNYALGQIEERGLPVDTATLARLALHYSDDVRMRATEMMWRRDVDPPTYKPEDAITPKHEQLLLLAASLTTAPVPADAPWVELTIAPPAEYPSMEPYELHGWLLERGGDGKPWRLLTNYGAEVTYKQKDVTATPGSLQQFAKHLLEQRKRYDETDDFDVRMGIEAEQGIRRFSHGSNDTWKGSSTELLVAAWSLQRGDRDTAASLLLPPLSTALDERDHLQPLLHELAAQLDEAMLQAFTGARNYGKTMIMASKLCSPALDGAPHQERARELLAQLQVRREDFQSLQLPTPARWQELQKTQSRAEQIAYLVARLQLLNCHQWSNPGWLDYSSPQFGPPNAAWDHLEEPEDQRINPFVELLSMDLAGGELRALLPALESRFYILAYDLQRFLPQRPQSLHRVAWVAATICNEVAQAAIVDPTQFLGEPSAHQAARAALLSYCGEHEGQRASDRLAQRMHETEDWQEVRSAFWKLHQVDSVRASATILEVARKLPEVLPETVRLLALLDRGEYVGEARDWLHAENADMRFFGAVLLLRHGQETAGAFAVVRDALSRGDGRQLLPAAVEALLTCQLPEARVLLEQALTGKHGYLPSTGVVQRLVHAGYQQAHDLLVDALAGKRTISSDLEERIDVDSARHYLLMQASTWWPGIESLQFGADAQALERLAETLQTRLAEDWQRITAQQPPTMQPAPLELPWGSLQSFSTGWIRRM